MKNLLILSIIIGIISTPSFVFAYELDDVDIRLCETISREVKSGGGYYFNEAKYQDCLEDQMNSGLAKERPRQAVIALFVILIGGSIAFYALRGRKKKSGTITQEYDRMTSPTPVTNPISKPPISIQNNVNEEVVFYPTQFNYAFYSKDAFSPEKIKPHKFRIEVIENHRNIESGSQELWILPIEIGNALQFSNKGKILTIPLMSIHKDKWKPDFNSEFCEIPYFDVPQELWSNISEDGDEEKTTQIIESHMKSIKIKINSKDLERFYKTLEAYRLKEFDGMYWETSDHNGVEIPYKTPFLGREEQLVISYDDPKFNAITVITNRRVFSYDFDRSIMDGSLFWGSGCDVSILNRHNVSQSVGSGSMIGVSGGGMRLGSFGGISSGTSKSVGDLLFTKDGTTYVRINNIAGVTGMAQHIKSIIRANQ